MSEPAPRLTPEVTWEDFQALPEDDRRELVDGELLELEVPTWLHEHIVIRLAYFLTAWGLEQGAVVIGSAYRVRISRHQGFNPDLQLYLADNPHRGQAQGLEQGHPDLAVEVISPGPGGCEAEPGETTSPSSRRHDRLTKVEGYARIGTPEYWIVDPEVRSIERLVLRDGLYFLAGGAAEDEVFRPTAFDGLEIPLAKLWNP